MEISGGLPGGDPKENMKDVAGTAVTTAPSAPSKRRVESRAGAVSSPSAFSRLRCKQGSPLSGSVMFALRVRVLEWIYIDVDMKNAHPMIVAAASSATSQRRAKARVGEGSSLPALLHLTGRYVDDCITFARDGEGQSARMSRQKAATTSCTLEWSVSASPSSAAGEGEEVD